VLSELVVHNFAIIRHLEISFRSGLNILSGETGAGKSILVGAVNLILGGRASQEMIRTGANEASVEAVFAVQDGRSVGERLSEWGLEPSEGIVIRRSISRSGRNRVFVNDQIVSLQQLQQLAKELISVSGQHEHQLLLDTEVHLGLLDTFGHLDPSREEVAAVYGEWAGTREKLQKMKRFKQEQASQQEWLRFQLQELESAKLQPDEDKLLDQERNLLKHAATLHDAARSVHQSLYAGRGAVLEVLSGVEKNLGVLADIDPGQRPLLSHLEQARIHLEELSHSVQQYAGQISFDPQRLAAVDERLALLQKLGKKYGTTVDEMIGRMEEIRRTLGEGEDASFQESEMEKALEALRRTYLEKAEALSVKRHEVALQLTGEVERVLAALDMARARFAVAFDRRDGGGSPAEPSFTPTGIDKAEFILSANPGEDLKPLAKVASGGELSRILLALKSILSHKGEAETLIFDEVDAGIGGRTAELVGVQLQRLAGKHQVICITHLPQIACYGEHHYKVVKQTDGEETTTHIHLMPDKERMEELARMLGGISVSEKARAHARELLHRARKEN
jgi:DNA repair protein RecN (Recombination protein N)